MNDLILDQADLAIMRMLQEDAWITTKQIALRLKKGNTTISRKIEVLKQMGYIKGSLTVIDHEKLGQIMISFTHIHMTDHGSTAMEKFQTAIIQFDEVRECFQMTGEFDFLVKIVVPDMLCYKRFLREKLAMQENVGALHSHFVIHEAKRDLTYPICV